jgi:hypothetical protein
VSESGLDEEARDVLASFVGKKLYAFEQAPNGGDFDTGHWCDDEPLRLTFEDGSVLEIHAFGWHNSGDLHVDKGAR